MENNEMQIPRVSVELFISNILWRIEEMRIRLILNIKTYKSAYLCLSFSCLDPSWIWRWIGDCTLCFSTYTDSGVLQSSVVIYYSYKLDLQSAEIRKCMKKKNQTNKWRFAHSHKPSMEYYLEQATRGARPPLFENSTIQLLLR